MSKDNPDQHPQQGTIRSERFDDIYFSPEDGLAETKHVFLANNNLPAAWMEKSRFTIAETGFGTGLNFLAAWTLFEDTAPSGHSLDYVSFEKFPLDADTIRTALEPWRHVFGSRLERMLALYPIRVPGFHRIALSGRVTLTLIFDDVNDAAPQLDAVIDAWFLDGFAPAKNPDMWSDTLWFEMARLSRRGTTFASFTAAGLVRRGLADAGFHVEKRKGYGRKRDMIAGFYQGGAPVAQGDAPRSAAIIGGGLAGTACAYVLSQAGIQVTLYESAPTLAPGASGNRTGLMNPRFSALRGAESDFYTAAYAQAVRTLPQLPDIDFAPCGSLHLIVDADKEKRFNAMLENWGWNTAHMRLVDAETATALAGVRLDKQALFLPDAGRVCPAALCRAYADGVDVRLDHTVEDINTLTDDIVILATGPSMTGWMGLPPLPLHTVRGQVTQAEATTETSQLRTNLCYGGYLTAAHQGRHVIGSTFQKWLHDTALRDEDDAANLDKLMRTIPLSAAPGVTGARAALRTVSRDHMPVAGALRDNIYVTTAHGSHGVISSLAAAHDLADRILGRCSSLPIASIQRLDPARFTEH